MGYYSSLTAAYLAAPADQRQPDSKYVVSFAN
jgi:hypothetical protein